ncbi:MAG: serine/threonine protein kinase, partial [Coleofasciculus sp. Co-bin14]|nr:serine/threonine protein kinase [Coleofasciculus sp. Co-bin14]
IDEDNRINFKPLVPKLSLRFIEWLEKLVQHNPKNRYANAADAWEAIKPIYVIRIPEVQSSQSSLEFKASKLGERLTQTITINNPIPETVLEGRWEVAPHPSDPPHTPETHAWIKVAPANFASNRAECRITVDTSQLRADKTYKRQILLHTNCATETYSIAVQVQTAAIPVATRKPPYLSLAMLGGFSFGLIEIASKILPTWNLSPVVIGVLMLVVLSGAWSEAVFGGVRENSFKHFPPPPAFKQPPGIGEILLCLLLWQFILIAIALIGLFYVFLMVMFSLIFVGAFIVYEINKIVDKIEKKGFSKAYIVALLILTIGFGSSLGVWHKLEALNLPTLVAVLGTGLPLAGMLLYPPIEQRRLAAKYRKSEQHLIQQ